MNSNRFQLIYATATKQPETNHPDHADRSKLMISYRRYLFSSRRWLGVMAACIMVNVPVLAQTADPDLANPSANVELIEAGSLIIPMDNDLQNAGLAYFNIRSYGLPHALLYADVPVKWAIRSGKGKDGVDFNAYAQRILPTVGVANNFAFRSGPFIVLSCFTSSVSTLISSYATQQNVAVYRVLSNFYCDVRYTLRHKPRVAILDDGGTESIHITALAAARIPTNTYIHLNATGMLALAENSCYTLCVAPHYLPSGSSETALHSAVSQQVAAVRAFLNGGGNLFAQCASMATYENQTSQGRFVSTAGLLESNVGLAPQYQNPDTPLNQFHGDINGAQGGSMTDFQLLSGSALRSNTYVTIRNQTMPTNYISIASKLDRNKRGSFIGYLGGHDYNAATTLSQINGRRVFMNSLFVPTLRPRDCELNFGSDLYVQKFVSTNIVYNGDPLSYTIIVSNRGPYTAIAATIYDYFPAEFTNATWTMNASPGCSPTNASGTGDIIQAIDIPEFGVAIFTAYGGVDATLCDPFDAACGVVNEARASWETCYSDIEPSNNTSRANITVFRSVISGMVRHDRDGNGVLTDPESGIPGVAVELWSDPNQDGSPADGALQYTSLTDSLGRYSFVELLPGYYVIKQMPVNGFDATGDTDGGVDSQIAIPLPVGFYVLDMDFLLQAEYSLTLSKQVSKEDDVDPGDILTYSISVLNAGTVNQTNVTITDVLSSELQYVTNSSWIMGYNGEVSDYAQDSLYSPTYTNSYGTIPWTSPWLEEGESDGPLVGFIMVTQTAFAITFSNNVVATRDTHIRRSSAAGNFGTATEMLIQTNASVDDRILIYFDLSTLTTNTVTEAILQIKPSRAVTNTIRIYEVNSNWTETGATWNNMATNHFTNIYATFVPSVTVYTNINVTTLVQRWLNQGITNRGIMLRISGSGDCRIRPRERAGEQPKLIVKQDSGGLIDYALMFRGFNAQAAKRSLNLSGYTSAVAAFYFDLQTIDPTDFVNFEISTNNINWTTITNIYGDQVGNASIPLPGNVYTTNFWMRFRNEGFGSTNTEYAIFDDISITVNRQAILSSLGNSPPNLAEGYELIPGGNLTVTFQAVVVGVPDELFNTACATSTENPGGICDTVGSSLGIVFLTQGVARAGTGWEGNELGWKGPENQVGISRYDLIYTDQDGKGFTSQTTNFWALAQTVTNETMFMDLGSITRTCPSNLSHTTMRFYRLAKPDKWRPEQSVRSASERVYAFKNVLLKPGENFISLFAVPDRNELAWVLGSNLLPAGPSMEQSTRVEWYGATTNGVATNMVWLSESGNWLHSSGGLANSLPIPMHEGFNLILPNGSSTQLLHLIGRVPETNAAEFGHTVPIKGQSHYNMVSYTLPYFTKLGESKLREAGFKGLSAGQSLSPQNSDELRILQRGGGSMASPSTRILMNASGQFVYWTGGTRGASAENYILQPDDSLIIYTVKSTNDWTWLPDLPYEPPNRKMQP